jgi:uncharacterized protein (TIGR03545 family)
MLRIFRWSYLAPRLIVLALVVLLSEYGVAWLLRWQLSAQGSSAVGAKVDVGQVRASVIGGRLSIENVAITNPAAPMENLVEIGQLEFDLSTAELLHKSAVIDVGAIRGLQFGTPRTVSGEIELAPEEAAEAASEPSWFNEQAASYAANWMDDLEKRFTADINQQFQSIGVAQELIERWPGKYAELEVAAKALKAKAEELKAQVKEAKKNPLRNSEFLARVPQEAGALDRQLKALYGQLDKLPKEAAADRLRIEAARKHDEQAIREKLAMKGLDAESLTDYLLGQQLTGPLRQVVGWLKWARKMMPSKPVVKAPERCRGVDVLFAGVQQRPDLLVRMLHLDGKANLLGQSVDLKGFVSDFTTQPKLTVKPAQLELQTTGSMPIKLTATCDRTQEEPHDELFADCRGIVVPKVRLGNSPKFRLSVEQSTASVIVSLQLNGEKLSGDIQLVQDKVHITPEVAVKIGDLSMGEELETQLKASLANVPQLATRVTLSGTLNKPQAKIWSNLGPAVATAVDGAIGKAAAQQAEKLIAKSQAKIDAQLAKFDETITTAAAKVAPELAGPANSLKTLVGGNVSVEQLGRQLPVGSLFK